MPDAAKLVAALCMAALGFVVSGLIMGLFDDEMNFGWFTQVNMALGAIVGWIVIGGRAGRGITAAINIGLTAPVVLVFWGLVILSANEMIRNAMLNRYHDAFDAAGAVFEIGVKWALIITTVPVWATLLMGGVIAGIASEYAWRTWR
jgi:uncharacterized membrane protein YraQ (UPF0718 family)